MSIYSSIIKEIWTKSWAIGLVEGGVSTILSENDYPVRWIKMPKDRWFADPFILDVTESEIQLLVEDFEYAKGKGCISVLHISRKNWKINKRKVLLQLPTHLSFPCILRRNGDVYVYPENCLGGKLDMYRYDVESETVSFYKTLCNEAIWDSVITTDFEEPLLFTAKQDDYHLDIFKWNTEKEQFFFWQSVISDSPNSRMGGLLFQYKDAICYPAQDCSKGYGCAIDVKKIEFDSNDKTFRFSLIKKLLSPHPRMRLGMHTLNEYKGFAVIDVQGYRYPRIVSIIECASQLKKTIFNGRSTKA